MCDYDDDSFDDIAENFITDNSNKDERKFCDNFKGGNTWIIKGKLSRFFSPDSHNRSKDEKITHTFINGGRLVIPYDKLEEVYNDLSKNKENPPICERIGAYGNKFKFFVDLDDELADVKEVVTTVNDTIDTMFKIKPEYTIWKNKNKEKYHIIYQFKVDKEEALNIIEFASKEINCDFDTSVYESGLRLPLCNKNKKDKNHKEIFDDSMYEYFGGLKGSYIQTGSILHLKNVDDLKHTDEYTSWLNSNDYKTTDVYKSCHKKEYITNNNTQPENIDNISCILNDMFDMNATWSCEKIENGYKISHDSYKCLVDNTVNHSDKDHSALFIHKRSCTVNCWSHGKKKILLKDYPQLTKLKEKLGLIIPKKTRLDVIKSEFKKVDLTDEDDDFIRSKLTTTHDDVACVFHRFFNQKYICGAETPKPLWFEYKDGVWSDIKGISKLRKDFTSGLINIYMTVKEKCEEEAKNSDNDELLLSMANICEEVCTKLKTTGYTDNLCKQIIHHFKYNDFIEELDKNRNLLCFGEDVYDLKTNEWRKTTPKDLCSKKCGITKDDVNDKYLEKLMDILTDIHPDEDRRDFFISSLSDLLYGKNTKELFHIWTGTGRNGKGVVSEILQHAFGEYYCSPSVSLITQRRASSNSANPELADTRGARIVMFTEPEEGSRLNNSIIKQYTGGDELTVRKLFGNPFSFTPHFTPIIQCNSFQMQDVKDDSIPARLLFMKFKTSFVDEPTMAWQRMKDESIKDEENINNLKGAMMFLLLNKWRDLSPSHKFKPPQSVIDDKNEFLDDNNNIKQFVDENIVFTEDNGDMLKAKELLSEYRTWMENRGERNGKLPLKMFIRRMCKYMPEYKQRHQPSVNGIQECHRNVFLRCKMNDNMDEYQY